jgi:hypothetical protein
VSETAEQRIRALADAGLSDYLIAQSLNDDGILTPSGRWWMPSTVYQVRQARWYRGGDT